MHGLIDYSCLFSFAALQIKRVYEITAIFSETNLRQNDITFHWIQ